MCIVKLVTLGLFSGDQEVSDLFQIDWLRRLPGLGMVLLCRISCGAGILGPIGMDQRSNRTASKDLFAGKVVLSTVLMVLTCLSMKPLGLGKCGEEV